MIDNIDGCDICLAVRRYDDLLREIRDRKSQEYRSGASQEEALQLKIATREIDFARWKADKNAWAELLSYLSHGQREILLREAYIDVRGSKGNTYRIYARPGNDNIILIDRDSPRALLLFCLQPQRHKFRGFTLLTQAMVLAVSEEDFRAVAVTYSNSTLLDSMPERYGKGYGPWTPFGNLMPSALIAAATEMGIPWQ